MKNKYYILFSCDEWKSQSSMSLLGVFNRKGLLMKIRKELRNNGFETELKLKEIKDLETNELNNALDYAYIEEAEINEEF